MKHLLPQPVVLPRPVAKSFAIATLAFAFLSQTPEKSNAQPYRYVPAPRVSVTRGNSSPYYGRGFYRSYSPYRYRSDLRGLLRSYYRPSIFGLQYCYWNYRGWR
ncbi:hypothetical protein Mal64_07490 [Pseudobythopirellula maris]|uniref:Uncharacterized protein n=1 Tax=Pseudobythopirellula maris TaxID=2527991 RepID=A0A5C5ZSY1_9BACT|nr:hypothetical protein [Pseudobythopirellula maris]TWT90360.1 hypothetical protein Mal64_07490 [Pseudobythopirellula maris]